jgi:hypothetical protein
VGKNYGINGDDNFVLLGIVFKWKRINREFETPVPRLFIADA